MRILAFDLFVPHPWRTYHFSPSKPSKKREGAVLHAFFFLFPTKDPYQLKMAPLTYSGITNSTTNNEKISCHKIIVWVEWSKRWFAESSLSLHKKHLFTMVQTPNFQLIYCEGPTASCFPCKNSTFLTRLSYLHHSCAPLSFGILIEIPPFFSAPSLVAVLQNWVSYIPFPLTTMHPLPKCPLQWL